MTSNKSGGRKMYLRLRLPQAKDLTLNGTPPTQGASDQKLNGVAKWIVSHFAILATMIPFSLTAINVMAISRGDPAVIVEILSAVSIRTVVLASILQLVPIVVFPLLIAVAAYCTFHIEKTDPNVNYWRFARAFAGAMALLMAFFTADINLAIFVVGLLILAANLAIDQVAIWRILRRLKRKIREINSDGSTTPDEKKKLILSAGEFEKQSLQQKKSNQKGKERNIANYVTTITALWVVSLLFIVAFSGSWLPIEVVHLKGQSPRVASVVSNDGDSVTLLYTNTTDIDRVPRSQIVSQTICEGSLGPANTTVAYLISSRGIHTPPCPSK